MTDESFNELANPKHGGTSRTLYFFKSEHATPNEDR